jgi:hypothetical protein
MRHYDLPRIEIFFDRIVRYRLVYRFVIVSSVVRSFVILDQLYIVELFNLLS